MANLTLRGLPEPLHEALKRAADRNHRSLNGEILARLEASLRPVRVDPETLLARVRERRRTLELPPLDAATLRELKDAGRP